MSYAEIAYLSLLFEGLGVAAEARGPLAGVRDADEGPL